ncbi:MAG TPA: CPBP family glutamic-type intramembrane protease [Cyclobacteriaceae bacterium]|nr:CPBP family glutamic-type intramembrane protease [Cyclobacteriaceae bacterium]
MFKTSNARRLLEVLAVMITGGGKFIFVDMLPYKFWFISAAIISWATYILFRSLKNPSVLAYWGFRKQNFRRLFLLLSPLALLVLTGFLIYGIYHKTLILSWHILPILFLYPIWGTIQQFLMVGLVASNLRDLNGITIPGWFIVIVTAILFSIVHFPSVPLVIATAMLGVFYTVLFLRYQNIWVLGIYHGWLGAFFYFFILERDPWLEVVNTF